MNCKPKILLIQFFLFITAVPFYALPKNVGIYTGTFDPPHKGHVETVKKAIEQARLDVIYIQTGIPEHKPNALSYEVRNEMIRHAFSDISELKEVSPEVKELFIAQDYIEAIRAIMKQHADDVVYRLIGSDKLTSKTVLSMADSGLNFIVNPRSLDDLNQPGAYEVLNRASTILLPQSKLQTSSTQIRQDFRRGVQSEHIDDFTYKRLLEIGAYSALSCKNLL